MSRPPREGLLSRMLAEARAEEPPALALESVQRRVHAEFRAAAARGELVTRRASARPRAVGWLAAVALTLGALWSITSSHAPSSPAALERVGLGNVGTRDGALLEAGVILVASDVAVIVEHAGRATWVLAPGSRARVLSTTPEGLSVELERGALDAAVVPSQRPASFVVVAAGTEVAVHGTRFGVSLDGDRASVAVSEGEVRVSALGHGEATLLKAGMQGEFLAGVAQQGREVLAESPIEPGAAALEATPGETSPASPPAAGTSQRATPAKVPHGVGNRRGTLRYAGSASASKSGAARSSPAAPGAESVELALTRVSERIQSCFRRHTLGRGELSIEASTRLRLLVQPNGSILEVRLDPPLAPAVESCVAHDLATLELGASAEGYRVEREIRLSR